MYPLLPPSTYTSSDVFLKEQQRIFQAAWQCVGLVSDFENVNDFLTCRMGGKSIVIQNLEGEIRAFDNICRHRHSIIQCKKKGNRALICPYHGWKYDKSGVATGIPGRINFDDGSLDNVADITLKRYRVGICGVFVFVSLADDGVSLPDFLGESADFLQAISAGFGSQVDEFELLEKTNWKVGVENTLEFYHVGLVHRESFAKLGAKEQPHAFQGMHSSTWAALPADDGRRKKLLSLMASRPYAPEGYVHQFIFPNLTIATTQGLSFSVQIFEPVSAGETRFVTRVYSTNYEGCPKPVAEAMAGQVAEFNRQVFTEDQTVCESVQLGLQEVEDSRPGLLSREEARVLAFQQAYLSLMDSAAGRE